MSSVLILWGKEEIRIERSEIVSLEWLKSDEWNCWIDEVETNRSGSEKDECVFQECGN